MRKGSLTIFFSMLLLSIMSLLFTMAECIHLYAMGNSCTLFSQEAIESSFSEYNPYIWDNYGILGVDMSGGFEKRNFEFVANIAKANGSIIVPTPVDTWMSSYRLITDGCGAAVIHQGAEYALSHMAPDLLLDLENQAGILSGSGNLDIDTVVEAAKITIEEAEEGDEEDEFEIEDSDEYDDPIDVYGEIKEQIANGVLFQVVPDTEALSSEAIDIGGRVSSRQLKAGVNPQVEAVSPVEKLLYIQYLMEHFNSYGQNLGHDGLQYEAEYVLAGKATDKENLAAAVERIFLFREVQNYAAILSDPGKMAEVAALAAAIGSVTLNPIVAEALKPAIIAIWAYVESVLDVRRLLSGGRVSFVKSSGEWTSDVFRLAGVLNIDFKAKNCDTGLSYKDYLRLMLTMESTEALGLRSCDVMENALNTQADYGSTKLDDLLVKADMNTKFTGNQLFFSFVFVNGIGMDSYEFTRKVTLAY